MKQDGGGSINKKRRMSNLVKKNSSMSIGGNRSDKAKTQLKGPVAENIIVGKLSSNTS